MAPFEALYGRACRSPILWDKVGERQLLGPQSVQQDAELVRTIRQRLLTAQSRQKSYADRRRRMLEFAVGDHVFLRVSPIKGVKRFGLKGKLAPRFIGPFQNLERIGAVAYRLALPPALAGVHNVFHVSMLRKYVPDPTHVLKDLIVPLQSDATYEEFPVRILDRKEHRLSNKCLRLVKIGWQHHSDQEATWEREEDMRIRYPHLFPPEVKPQHLTPLLQHETSFSFILTNQQEGRKQQPSLPSLLPCSPASGQHHRISAGASCGHAELAEVTATIRARRNLLELPTKRGREP
ncbi:uncharacterized protein LOC122029180 [Zingiber officinale]|uniref:uncharacterized protein LOC122029180 n=1 Tax=Zingiber officinale TaxID=94328 RepID=UPI001C4C3EA9|nr:uncharacterized protein LOC122029180 [Zingiber officinale]